MEIPIDVTAMIQEKCGKHIISYLARYVKDTKYRKFIKDRAHAFDVHGQALQLCVNADYMLDIGGQWTNNFNVLAVVDLQKGNKLLSLVNDAIGFTAKPENTRAVFVCRRFVDVAASTRYNRFLLSFSEGVIAVCSDRDGVNQRAVCCTIDREGVVVRSSSNPQLVDIHLATEYVSKDMVDRKALINAFSDRLIGLNPDGTISYWGFELSDEWSSEPVEFAGFRGLMFNPPTSFSRLESTGLERNELVVEGDEQQNLRIIEDLRPPGVDADIGGGGGSGGGTGGRSVGLPITPCHQVGYPDRGTCLGCCETRLATGLGIAAGLAVSLGLGCLALGPFAVVCELAAAASVGIVLTYTFVGHNICITNCIATYPVLSLEPQSVQG